MHRRTTRLNRILFVLIGVVLLAAGGFLLARHYDLIDSLSPDDRLYSRTEARWLHDHDWVWYLVGALIIVLGLVALRWLLVQPRLDRVRSLRLDPDLTQAGRTSMAADVFTDVVEEDIEQVPGVLGARALVIGAADAPELIVRVSAEPVADLADIHRQILDEALPAARTALDTVDVPAQIHLHVSGRKAAKRIVL